MRELVGEKWEIWWKNLPKATWPLTCFDTREAALAFYRPEHHRLVHVRRYALRPRWGVFDVEQQRWWPRDFASAEEARAHYERCKGPGSRGEVRLRTEKES